MQVRGTINTINRATTTILLLYRYCMNVISRLYSIPVVSARYISRMCRYVGHWLSEFHITDVDTRRSSESRKRSNRSRMSLRSVLRTCKRSTNCTRRRGRTPSTPQSRYPWFCCNGVILGHVCGAVWYTLPSLAFPPVRHVSKAPGFRLLCPP